MPTYKYECEDCGEVFFVTRSILSDKEVDCPCGLKCSNIIITGGADIINKTPRSVGMLAEQNTRKFGREYCAVKEQEARERRIKARQHLKKEVEMADGGIGIRAEPKADYKPSWRDGAIDKSLGRLNKEQGRKYAKDGTKPV